MGSIDKCDKNRINLFLFCHTNVPWTNVNSKLKKYIFKLMFLVKKKFPIDRKNNLLIKRDEIIFCSFAQNHLRKIWLFTNTVVKSDSTFSSIWRFTCKRIGGDEICSANIFNAFNWCFAQEKISFVFLSLRECLEKLLR